MWAARDKDGSLCLFEYEPNRHSAMRYWESENNYVNIDNELLPELRWEDEPVIVEISLVKK